MKENICGTGFIYDLEDESVTRSDEIYKELFKRSGLKIIKNKCQTNFPKELFKVEMYALRKID